MVSCDFILLNDQQWHILPQNAVNIVFESRGSTADVYTSHDGTNPGGLNEIEHLIGTLTPQGPGNKDHLAIDKVAGFCLQKVRADITGGTGDIRVYFNRIKL